MHKLVTRRSVLKAALCASAGILAACQPKVVEVTRVVEKEKVVKETVEVEKIVKEAVEVEKEVTRVVEKDVDKAAQAAAALKGELTWDTFRRPGSGWNEERIAAFEKKFPNVTVEFRPIVVSNQQEAYGKMYAQHAAGDLGDICAFDPSHYHFWRAIDKGIILPITDLVDADGLDLTEWFDAFIAQQWYKGDIYGLPSWGWTGYDLFVANKLHFDEAGIDLNDPTSRDHSLEDIEEWGRKLKVGGEGGQVADRYGIALAGGDAGQSVLTRAFGGDVISEDGTKCLLLEEESIAAHKWAYKLNVEDRVTPAPGDLSGGNQNAWAAGKLSMYHGGSLNVINANKAITDKELAEIYQILWPLNKNGQVPSQLRGGTWNINKATKYPQECYEFLKHIAGQEGTVGFNLVGGNGALTRPDVLPILTASNPLYAWFLDTLANGIAVRFPANSRGREFTDALGQYWGKLMDPRDPIPFDQGMQEMADNVQKVLDMDAP